ncbi:hypothetical protein M569_16506 [Genlisea aurea]|uniref:Uncharacterized protein n=1 Tax=Genlisea aurea TaxID=192259 RepID=S8BUQ5_9LAMI|nr:hypothetical protein M569_16506 [Genlisea aurea]
MAAPSSSFCKLISETTGIIAACPFHFSALSALFLLPVSISAVLQHPFLFPEFDSGILHVIFVLIFSLSSSASIAYTTLHGYYGRPPALISALKAIPVSLLPLLATLLLILLIAGTVASLFAGSALVSYNVLLSAFGFEMDYDDGSFLAFAGFWVASLLAVIVRLSISWNLAMCVAAVEREWGFAALRRSCFLVKGVKKTVVLTVVLMTGFWGGVLGFWCSDLTGKRNSGGGRVWIVIQIGGFVALTMVGSVYAAATNTVLWIICSHQEFKLEVSDEEMAGDYLPPPEHHLPHPIITNH